MRVTDDRVAIVTGGSGGIGRCIAVALAAEGYSVHITGRNRSRLDTVVSEMRDVSPGDSVSSADPSRGPTTRFQAWQVDFSQREELDSWVDEVQSAIDRLDLLVLNAGTAFAKPIEDTSVEEWDRIFDINVRAPFVIARGLLPLLRRAPGRIITIGSVVSKEAYRNQGAYTATKHALHGFTKVLAKELHSEGIIVQSILPGGVATDLVRTMRPDIDTSDLIQPEAVAEAVVALLNQSKSAITDEINLRRRGKEPMF